MTARVTPSARKHLEPWSLSRLPTGHRGMLPTLSDQTVEVHDFEQVGIEKQKGAQEW